MSQIFVSSHDLHSTHKDVLYHRTENLDRCRICLEESGVLMCLPCSCRGELGRVHEKCFCKWIQTSSPNLQSPNPTLQTKCQICQTPLKTSIKTQTKPKTCQQLKQSHRLCQITSAFISMGVIVFLIYLCIRGIIGNQGGSFIMYIVYALVIVFLVVVLKVVIQLTWRIFRKVSVVSVVFMADVRDGNDVAK